MPGTNPTFEIVHSSSDTTLWTSTLPSQTLSTNCDSEWTSNNSITSTIVPALQNIVQNNIKSTMPYAGDIICSYHLGYDLPNSYKTSSSLFYDTNYRVYYYNWIYADSTCDAKETYYTCCTTGTCNDYISNYSNLCKSSTILTKPIFYQEMFYFEPPADYVDGSTNNKYILQSSTACADCTLYSDTLRVFTSIKATNIGSDTCSIKLHYLKITIKKTGLTGHTCSSSTTNDCPPGYYCNSTTNECNLCHVSCATCTNSSTCTSCSRFTQQWKTGTSTCTLEYLDLKLISNLTFTNVPAIKTGRASVSFWLYLDNINLITSNVAHVVVKDQMVVTIFRWGSNIHTYCTAHHLYHPLQTTILENITTRTNFTTALGDVSQIYNTSNINSRITNISKRWFYTRCAVNYHSNEYYIMNSYNKSFPYKDSSLCNKNNITKGTIPFEKVIGSQTTDFHFSKFYRENDTINVKVNNFKYLGPQVLMRNLYVFADYIPSEIDSMQYYNIHKIVNIGEYPEFIFAVPFDEFTLTVALKTLNYYTNPYNGKTALTLSMTASNTTFTYPRNLYRLNLISQANKKFSTRDADISMTTSITCGSNRMYCFDTNKAFVCNSGYYLNISDFSCNSTCPTGFMIGRGLETTKGYCQKICSSASCNTSGINTLSCATGYIRIFDQCLQSPDSQIYTFAKERSALYYSHFFNLPPVFINLAQINPSFDFHDYYLEFFWMYETISNLRPTNTINYFFYTNSFKLYHNSGATVFNLVNSSDAEVTINSSLISLYNWNKFTFKVKSDGTGVLWINNNNSISINFTATSLQYIIFCHIDSTCQAGNTVNWSGGWYRNIRIWDAGTYYINDKMVFNYQVYDNHYKLQTLTDKMLPFTSRPSYIPLEFQLNIEQIHNNILRDSESSYFINVKSSTAALNSYNTDNIPAFNYSTKFDLIHLNAQPNKYINDLGTATTCDSNCKSCWSSSDTNCNTVNPTQGYFLNSSKTNFPGTFKNFYVYVSPTSSNEDIVFTNTNLGGKVTITFFVKIIGFSEYPVADLIKFGIELKLRYDHTTKKLELFRMGSVNLVIASYIDFHTYFGSYVFISLSYAYDPVKTFFPAMMSFQVNKNNLVIDQTNISGMNIQSITIPKSVFAMFAKLHVYNNYLLGAYGYETNTYFTANSPTLNPVKVLIANTSNCFNISDLSISVPQSKIMCYLDYDPYLNLDLYSSIIYTTDASPSLFFLIDADGVTTNNNTCSISQICYETCYGEESDKCSCRNDSISYFILKNSNANICKIPDYLDFARLDSTTINNIKASSEAYTFEIWIFIYLYNSVNPGLIQYNISWNKQLKININYTNSNLQATCYPAYDASNPSNYISQNTSKNIGNHQWTYIRCSASRDTSKYFMLSSQSSQDLNTNELSFLSFPSVVPSTTTLNFNDNSVNSSWGILHFRQIRLWQCYTCFNIMTYLKEILTTQSSYANLNHIFDPYFNKNYTIYDLTSEATDVNAQTRSNFFGYNVIEESNYSLLTLCDENDDCSPLPKISDFTNFEFVEIPVSKWGRYTMEFWTLITDVTKLNKGLNLIWREHLSVSLTLDDNSTDLNVTCLPQNYLHSPEGKSGSNLKTFLTSVHNSDFKTISSPNSVWIWIRCAVSWDMKSFYLIANTANPDKTLDGEYLYDGQNSDFPFRYFFKEDSTSSFIIENADTNNSATDIYIRNVYLFDEYLPSSLIFKYTLLTGIDSENFPNLMFSLDFLNHSIYAINLNYYTKTNKSRKIDVTKATGKTVQYDYDLTLVSLCDLKANKYYDSANNVCATMTSCNSVTTQFCYEDDRAIFCKNNYYLNPNTLTCDSTCPNGLIRSPGSDITRAICNFTCGANHSLCDFTVNQMKNYPDNLKCNSEYTRVGYNCYNSIVQNESAMVFNRCYNFPSVYNTFSDYLKNLTAQGYILEFWFKMDLLNEFCDDVSDGTKKYLFYSFPHSFYITQGDLNPILKYQNLADPSIIFTIKNFNKFEWNIIIITIKKNKFVYSVQVMSNLTYSPAEVDALTKFDQNILGLAFCTGNGICNPGGQREIFITWSAAFYKNIRIYGGEVSIKTAIDFISGNINGNLKEILLYYDMSSVNADLNKIKNTITNNSNHIDYSSIYDSGILYSVDKNILFNSSANFDWGKLTENSGKYITNISSSTLVVTSESCYINCKRCISNTINKCYECKSGYYLDNGYCKSYTQFYLRVPPNLKTFTKLKLVNETKGIDIQNEPKITITFWIKFWGQIAESTNPCAVIIRLNEIKDSYICYDNTNKTLKFYYQSVYLVFNYPNFSDFNGQWVFLAISNLFTVKNDMFKYFPNMINFYIMNNVIKQEENYSIPSPGLQITNLDLGYEIHALFADVRFYKNFIIQPYGFVTNSKNLDDLILQYSLMGSTDINCLNNNEISIGNVSQLGIKCVPEYITYLDPGKRCEKNELFMNPNSVIKNDILICSDCDPKCSKLNLICSGNDNLKCICNMNTPNIWFRQDKEQNLTYCDQPPYLDFSKYQQVNIPNLKSAVNDEYTIEFWTYIYPYLEDSVGFDSFEIIWDNHSRVILFNDKNKLKARCNPIYSISNPNMQLESAIEPDIKYFRWTYIQCSTSIKKSKFYINTQPIQKLINSQKLSNANNNSSSLVLKYSQDAKTNFGFIFLREIKLWSIFNLREFFTECTYKLPSKIKSLLHYFPINTKEEEIDDKVQGVLPTFEKHKDFMGYNIIDKTNTKNIEEIPFDLDFCSYLDVTPKIGYYKITNFLVKCDDPNSTRKKNYKFYYSISESQENGNSTKIPLTDYQDKSEINFAFNSTDLYGDFHIVNIFCDAVDFTVGTKRTSYDRIELYINNQIEEPLYKDYIDLYKSNDTLTDEQLLTISVTLGSLAENYYQSVQINRTILSPQSGQDLILIREPICYSEYCNNRGDCYLIDRMLTCLCHNGFHGFNCQLNTENKNFLLENYNYIWNLLTYDNYFALLKNSTEFNTRINAISWIVNGASKISNDQTLLDSFIDFINFSSKNISDKIAENFDLIFEDLNKILIRYQYLANLNKIQNKVSNNSNIDRNSTLNFQQQQVFRSSLNKIKSTIENTINSFLSNQNENYTRKNKVNNNLGYDVIIQQVDPSFDLTDFFQTRNLEYKGLFKCKDCFDQFFKNNQKLNMIYINYKINPFFYDDDIYQTTLSLVNSIYFTDLNGNKITIENLVTQMEIYFPLDIYNQNIIDYINNNKYLFYPNNTVEVGDPLVSAPVYVFPNGTVSNMTQAERINKYHRQYNFQCKYFNQELSEFVGNGLSYFNYTENYLVCKTSHFSDFNIFFTENKINYVLEGPFFYLKYPQVFLCIDNYIGNKCFLVILGIFLFMILIGGLFLYFDLKKFKQEALLDFIKYQILKDRRRYLDEIQIYEEFVFLNRLSPEIFNDSLDFQINEMHIERRQIDDIRNSKENSFNFREGHTAFKNEDFYSNRKEIENNLENDKKDKKQVISPLEKDKLILEENKIINDDLKLEIINIVDISNKENTPRDNEDIQINNYAIKDNKIEEDVMSSANSRKPIIIKDGIEVSKFNPNLDNSFINKNPSCMKFLCRNLIYRHIYLSPFSKRDSFNPRYKKIIVLFNMITMMLFINTLVYTYFGFFNLIELIPENITIMNMIIYAMIVAFAGNLVMLIVIPFFRIGQNRKDKLYDYIVKGYQLGVLYEWEMMTQFNKKISIFGFIINAILMILAFYFTVNYCSVLVSMQLNLIMGWGAAVLIDALIMEPLMELFLVLIFFCRNTKILGWLFNLLNSYRNFKSLL